MRVKVTKVHPDSSHHDSYTHSAELLHYHSGMRLSYLQVAILLATGLQHRDVDAISAELDLPVNQVLAFFNKVRVRYPSPA